MIIRLCLQTGLQFLSNWQVFPGLQWAVESGIILIQVCPSSWKIGMCQKIQQIMVETEKCQEILGENLEWDIQFILRNSIYYRGNGLRFCLQCSLTILHDNSHVIILLSAHINHCWKTCIFRIVFNGQYVYFQISFVMRTLFLCQEKQENVIGF